MRTESSLGPAWAGAGAGDLSTVLKVRLLFGKHWKAVNVLRQRNGTGGSVWGEQEGLSESIV